MTRIGIVAGESSGDRLGAGLIQALCRHCPGLSFEGIAGPKMIEAGAKSLYPMERLAVMGIGEVFVRYWEIREIQKGLLRHFLEHPPDLFIGIDAPEFNLRLAEPLRQAGIRTVHYVSPQVWAWREGRLARITRAVDLMLVLFPFEERYYQGHGIPVRYVGHPLADEIPLAADPLQARAQLGLPLGKRLVALLPGSRMNEWHYHMDPFIRTAQWLSCREPGLHFAVPAVNERGCARFEKGLTSLAPDLPISLYAGRSHEVMEAADVVLTVSGTASLEAMLLKRAMVVVYRMGLLSYLVARGLVRLPYFSLPNLLAGRKLVPELLQGEVRPDRLGPQILNWLMHPEAVVALQEEFTELHRALRREASSTAAEAVLELLGQ
jgi:lipid-A-disaccharide synthase